MQQPAPQPSPTTPQSGPFRTIREAALAIGSIKAARKQINQINPASPAQYQPAATSVNNGARIRTFGFSGTAMSPKDIGPGMTLVPIARDLQWLYDRSLVTPKAMTHAQQLVERISRLEFAMRQAIRVSRHESLNHKLGEKPFSCTPCLLYCGLQRDDLGMIVYSCSDEAMETITVKELDGGSAEGGMNGIG